MFLPKTILHTSIVAPNDKLLNFISILQKENICQIDELSDWDKKVVDDYSEVFSLKVDAEKMLEGLHEYKPAQKLNPLDVLFPKTRVREVIVDKSINDIILNAKDEIEKLKEKTKTNIKELEKELENEREKLRDLNMFPDNLDFSVYNESEVIGTATGLILKKAISDVNELPGVKVITDVDKRMYFLAIFFGKKDKNEVIKELHEIGFVPIKPPMASGKPRLVREEINKKIDKLTIDINREEERLTKIWEKEHRPLEGIIRDLEIVMEKLKAIGSTETGYAISKLNVWLPERNWKRFTQLANRYLKPYYITSIERKDAPTLLNNPQPIKAFERITALYGYPKYGHIDPTPILAFSFALFFGFMLTDAVYGIAMMLIGFLIAHGLGRTNQGIKDFGYIISLSGLFTTMLGALFGSWLGSLLTDAFHIPYWIDPMKQATIVLLIALAVGLTHITVGLLLGLIEKIKRKEYLDAMRPSAVMLTFILGMLSIVIGKLIGINLLIVGLALIGLSVVLNFIGAYLQSGAILAGLSIFDYTGFLGDWFSYARLMSLALGTGGIALAVNFMAKLAGDMVPLVGWVVALTIVIFGHAFNMGINSLGAFVHSLRLHFLEFFSKFYEGGGEPYSPFNAKKRITEV